MSAQVDIGQPLLLSEVQEFGPAGRIGERKTMTKRLKFLGAALLALAILPAALMLFHMPPAMLISLGLGVAGTVTFTYESFQHSGSFGGGFTGGSNVAPTAGQAQQVQAMSALVGFTDTDTTWTFTHNWGLSAAQAAALLPQVIINIAGTLQAVAVGVAPIISVNVTGNTNAVVFTKQQATGSGSTVSIWLRRAHTIGL